MTPSKSLVKPLILIGSVLGALTAIFVFFGTYGWITRDAYAQDHGETPIIQQMAQIQTLLISIKVDQEKNQAQWECDEIDEELPDLEEALQVASSTRDKIDLGREIQKQEEHWADLNCSQFTE